MDLKLFVVGEADPDPENWSDWGGWTLVLARTPDEARKLGEGYPSVPVTEVPMDRPKYLVGMPSIDDPSFDD